VHTPYGRRKRGGFFKNTAKTMRQYVFLMNFFFESVENVSKNPIEFAVTGESVESVED
jgi:hypothetical protein